MGVARGSGFSLTIFVPQHVRLKPDLRFHALPWKLRASRCWTLSHGTLLGSATLLVAVKKRDDIWRDIDLILHDNGLVDFAEHVVTAVRINGLAVESQDQADVLALGVVLHGVDDFEIRLIVNLRFALQEVLAKLAHLQVEV